MSLYRQFESKENLLRQYLLRRDKSFGHISTPVSPNIRRAARAIAATVVDLAARTSALTYRGCPFVNIAVEFPDRSHVARQMVAATKRVYWSA